MFANKDFRSHLFCKREAVYDVQVNEKKNKLAEGSGRTAQTRRSISFRQFPYIPEDKLFLWRCLWCSGLWNKTKLADKLLNIIMSAKTVC